MNWQQKQWKRGFVAINLTVAAEIVKIANYRSMTNEEG